MKNVIKALNLGLIVILLTIAYKGYKDYKALVSMPETKLTMFFNR